jgi:hypothetical protein
MRQALAAIALTFTIAGTARAGSGHSDLWWNPDESGWGASITQQGNILFVVIFAYSSSGAASWLVGPRMQEVLVPGSTDPLYSGPLYETKGPWFGGAFDPDDVSVRTVGSVGITFHGYSNARIAYTADGTQVSKDITRQTWEASNLSGEYLGASSFSYFCPAFEARRETGVVTITQGDGRFSMRYTAAGRTCDYSGNYIQRGRIGMVLGGSAACTDGSTHNFDAHRIEGQAQTFSMEMSVGAAGSGCRWGGRLVGVQ